MNKKISVLLVEDDLLIGAHIADILKKQGYDVVDNLIKGEDVPGFIATNQVDVILMDINLAGQLDGIEAAKIVNQTSKIPVVFLTSNVDDASFQKAKEAFPIGFIGKPFKAEELLRTLELIFNQADFGDGDSESQEAPQEFLKDRIFVRDKDKMVKLNLNDILYVEAGRNYCQVFTKLKTYTLSIPLIKFAKKLESNIFLRIHRSFLINVDAVEALDDHFATINGNPIPLGKTYKQELMARLKLI